MQDLDTQVLRAAEAWRRESLPVVLVTVARTWGSSPRPPGSRMRTHRWLAEVQTGGRPRHVLLDQQGLQRHKPVEIEALGIHRIDGSGPLLRFHK